MVWSIFEQYSATLFPFLPLVFSFLPCLYSLVHSQGNTLGAVHCVLVQQAFNGGMVEGDGLVMGLDAASYQHVLHCIRV